MTSMVRSAKIRAAVEAFLAEHAPQRFSAPEIYAGISKEAKALGYTNNSFYYILQSLAKAGLIKSENKGQGSKGLYWKEGPTQDLVPYIAQAPEAPKRKDTKPSVSISVVNFTGTIEIKP